MPLTTPPEIAALPVSITEGVTTGLDDHLEALYAYVKGLAQEINDEFTASGVAGNVPTGGMVPFGGSAIPTGWAECNGQQLNRTTEAGLFAVLGTSFGNGDGSTTFNVPNLQGRAVMGHDTGDTDFDTVGETGGAKTHTLSTAEMPQHNHGVTATTTTNNHSHGISTDGNLNTSHTHNGDDVATGVTGAGTNGSTSTDSDSHSHTISVISNVSGSGDAHNNLGPYQVTKYIIKL